MSHSGSTTPDLIALVGSRICHDLVSPLGAIGNGVELLGMTGTGAGGPEMTLISESVASANARIRFFRIAFGAAEPGQTIGRAEILSVLGDTSRGGKLEVRWRAPGDVQRIEAKLMFLLLQCLESAMPFGGAVEVGPERGRWRVVGEAERMRVDPAVWGILSEGPEGAAVTPARVHFALAHGLATRMGRLVEVDLGMDRIEVTA